MKAESKTLFGRILLMGIAALTLGSFQVQAQAPAKTLKEVYKGKFLIGTAFDYRGNMAKNVQDIIVSNYDIVTPENCMKPQPIHPTEEQYSFDAPDALVKFCQDNKMQTIGHTLAWHSQTANWFFQGITADNKDLLKQRFQKHIHTVVGRYKGKIKGWDVVNEAINDGGNAQTAETENLRRSSWSSLLGPEFLTLAFKYAREADPDVELHYNDYNIEFGPKHKSAVNLLKRLKADGAPITGVGIQAHWDMGTNFEEVENSIKDFEALGLKIMITELDITIGGSNSGAMGFGGPRGGAPSTQPVDNTENFKKQAEKYKQAFEMFLRHPSITRVTFWGYNDSMSWKRQGLPLLHDGQMNPKPAFQAVIDAALAVK